MEQDCKSCSTHSYSPTLLLNGSTGAVNVENFKFVRRNFKPFATNSAPNNQAQKNRRKDLRVDGAFLRFVV